MSLRLFWGYKVENSYVFLKVRDNEAAKFSNTI